MANTHSSVVPIIEDGPPGRRYRAEDLEGQRWFFIQRAA